MFVAAALLLSYAPDLNRLGSDDFATREAEHRRLDNPLSALMLPRHHEDPEVDFRIKRIRAKNLKQFDPFYIERKLYREDFVGWVRGYLVTGRTMQSDDELFAEWFGNTERVNELAAVLPDTTGRNFSFLRAPLSAFDFVHFVEYLDAYRDHIAPAPRAKP